MGMAERRGFKWALLGLVAERDAYGYQLVQRCEAMLGDAYQLNPSAIYTSLAALEKSGFVTVVGQHLRGTKLSPRVLFGITPAGAEAFEEWIASAPFEPVRSDLASKFALVRPKHAKVFLEIIDAMELESMTMIRELSARIARIGGDPWQEPLLKHSQEYGLDLLNARVNWLRRGRAALQEQLARYEVGLLGHLPD
jgi:DNA-binding PadR family transcriptional regulator